MTAPRSRVFLVGAGPGDPELLTLRATRLIREADVVVYDRLVSAEVLDLAPTGTARIFVGKAPGRHALPQAEINELLVRLARAGRRVVRLKGGDPLIFGRGGEEVEYLAANGIACEVVPGITAAAGCAAELGIPLTHRGLATGVRFVTGHCRVGEPLDLNWQSLADPETTLVVYMGLQNATQISRSLIAAGLDPATPAAIIVAGTTPGRRTYLTDLVGLPTVARERAVTSPVLFVIGRVVSLAGQLMAEPDSVRLAEVCHA